VIVFLKAKDSRTTTCWSAIAVPRPHLVLCVSLPFTRMIRWLSGVQRQGQIREVDPGRDLEISTHSTTPSIKEEEVESRGHEWRKQRRKCNCLNVFITSASENVYMT
jgi:hypothetical protein